MICDRPGPAPAAGTGQSRLRPRGRTRQNVPRVQRAPQGLGGFRAPLAVLGGADVPLQRLDGLRPELTIHG
jgi:hypothetical protein